MSQKKINILVFPAGSEIAIEIYHSLKYNLHVEIFGASGKADHSKFIYDELPAMVPIHKGKLVHPMSLHYSKQYNTLIIYTILNLQKKEWHVAQAITQLVKK